MKSNYKEIGELIEKVDERKRDIYQAGNRHSLPDSSYSVIPMKPT